MKIPYMVGIGIAIVGIIVFIGIAQSYDNVSENKIRVAFFPSIVHAVPIVGLENQTFANNLGDEIYTRLSPDIKVINSMPAAHRNDL